MSFYIANILGEDDGDGSSVVSIILILKERTQSNAYATQNQTTPIYNQAFLPLLRNLRYYVSRNNPAQAPAALSVTSGPTILSLVVSVHLPPPLAAPTTVSPVSPAVVSELSRDCLRTASRLSHPFQIVSVT
jgi:hypothetical protein